MYGKYTLNVREVYLNADLLFNRFGFKQTSNSVGNFDVIKTTECPNQSNLLLRST